MILPEDFKFSQNNLQDYVECAKRFELRHIQRMKWPAVEAEPIAERELHMQRGADFHRMIQQHMLGVPVDVLSAAINDDNLRRWWDTYLQDDFVATLSQKRVAEVALSVPVSGHRLMAKYDLVAIEAGQGITIVDWKTSRRKPSRTVLAKRLQTIVYRYVMVGAGAHLNGGQAISPQQVEMVYWYAEKPDEPERFLYDDTQHKEYGEYLASLTEEIKGRSKFELTTETKRCRFCVYRSFCERGIAAGNEDDLEIDIEDDTGLDIDFDFDQIAEIEF